MLLQLPTNVTIVSHGNFFAFFVIGQAFAEINITCSLLIQVTNFVGFVHLS